MSHPAEDVAAGMEKQGWIGTAISLGLMAMPMITDLISRWRGGGQQQQQQQQGFQQLHQYGPQHGYQYGLRQPMLGSAGVHPDMQKQWERMGYTPPSLEEMARMGQQERNPLQFGKFDLSKPVLSQTASGLHRARGGY